jgi:lysophospholipase L1-like esterase
MTLPDAPAGMVDELPAFGAATAEEMAFGRAFVTPGPLDPAMVALVGDPDRIREREARTSRRLSTDWAQIGRYRDANRALVGQPVRAVLIGDSITEAWPLADPALFSEGIVGRGISGQTSPQILVRMTPDAVALKPRAVHILCGINDIAGNTGPTTPQDYRNALSAMATVVTAAGARLIVGSITPAAGFAWRPDLPDPRPRIRELNAWLQDLAETHCGVFADYHAVLRGDDDELKPEFTRDGVHPLIPGYDRMRPVFEAALAQALSD